MKQLQAKLSTGILTAVMILGMVFTMAPMKADAATYPDQLNIKVVDSSGNPLADMELVFEKKKTVKSMTSIKPMQMEKSLNLV